MAAKAEYAPVRLDAAGNIRAAAGKLTWLIVTNTNGSTKRIAIFNDAITGETGEVFQVGVPANDTKFLSFNPPMLFTTGIRAGTVGAGLIITGGFVD